MKKGDMLLILLALSLLVAAILTLLFGGEKSRHGVGMKRSPLTPKAHLFALETHPSCSHPSFYNSTSTFASNDNSLSGCSSRHFS